ncbi:MAG TPA: hypothetical protein VL972_07000 [Solirubrobacteraceae bacterium]|nr:hypothetical protein [Solirubrobacteraceae bacterium]
MDFPTGGMDAPGSDVRPSIDGSPLRAWVLQDWEANAGRPDSRLLLAWYRLAQRARRRWGGLARVVVTPYWWLSTLVVGVELPLDDRVGPRLCLHHPHNIVVNPQTTIGADCVLRHGVTIGNQVDRQGNERGTATIGDGVELGAGCAVIGDIHVGDHARVGALAMVTKSLPAWAVAVGNPARVIAVDAPEEHEQPAATGRAAL